MDQKNPMKRLEWCLLGHLTVDPGRPSTHSSDSSLKSTAQNSITTGCTYICPFEKVVSNIVYLVSGDFNAMWWRVRSTTHRFILPAIKFVSITLFLFSADSIELNS
jgi:hypothetical protein